MKNKSKSIFLILLNTFFLLEVFSQSMNGIKVHLINEPTIIDFNKIENSFLTTNLPKVIIIERFDSTKSKYGSILNYCLNNRITFDEKKFNIDLYYFHNDSGVQLCKLEDEMQIRVNSFNYELPYTTPTIYIISDKDSLESIKTSFNLSPLK